MSKEKKNLNLRYYNGEIDDDLPYYHLCGSEVENS